MTARMMPRHVTRIRGEFTASEKLQDAVRAFYDDEHQPVDVRLHTTAQRIVPRRLYHEHVYDRQITQAKERLQDSLAKHALKLLRLPSPMMSRSYEGQPQITFNAHPTDTLRLITEALEEIPSWESSQLQTGVLLALGRIGLHKDPLLLNAAKQNLLEALHDSAPFNALAVDNVHISERDKLNYPVRSNLYWPD